MERSLSQTRIFYILIFVLWNLMFVSLSCLQVEKEALLSFKQSLSDPANRLSSWSSPDCCKWSGISCHKKTGRVIKLDLRNRDQYQDGFSFNSQEVNSSLLHLKYLQYLDVSMNDFQSIPIPNFFGNFHELRYLNLSNAGFGGNVPHHLGNLSNLRSLNLECVSQFCMKVDGFRWVSALSSLQFLDMTGVDLRFTSNPLRAINLLPRLLYLRLRGCHMSATPNLFYDLSNLTALTVLDLSRNSIKGPIPSHLNNLTSLEVLVLSSNSLNGKLPDYLGSMIKLNSIQLSANYLDGTLKNVFSNKCNLKSLSLWGNDFHGEFPNLFQNSSCLETSRLETLELNLNRFNGTIPPYLGNFTSLTTLDLSSNFFHGVMTEVHFDMLSNLKVLDLRHNRLSLEMRAGWVPPFQLEIISLTNNKVGPEFPFWLTTQNKLNILELPATNLKGELPESLFNFSHADSSSDLIIDLSYNQLQGRIPSIFKYDDQKLTLRLNNNNFSGTSPHVPPNTLSIDLSHNFLSGSISQIFEASKFLVLAALNLAHNSFSGTIPYSTCNFEELDLLDLSANKFTGGLPNCLGNLTFVSTMDISSNELIGVLPESIGRMNILQRLHLGNNNFNGRIPSSIKNCSYLRLLDLSENNFSGSIHPWNGENWQEVRFLSLRSNELSGSIPLQLCGLKKLQFLDLAQNKLSGTIPHCFSNFTQMVTQQVGSWYTEYDRIHAVIKGKKVEYLHTLDLVILLDLSSNNLFGGIPASLMKLHGMQALNLSRNRL